MESDNIISDVWKIEQEILDVVHSVCVENNLRYSLAFGTLLGAVRHSGFIPWDDDIDIMMPREDYEKLIKIWKDTAPEGYILQDYRTDLDYTNNFAKIRKNHTTFLQTEEERKKTYHKGIFIDIFPADKVARGKILREIQYVACAINLLYSRGYTSGTKGVIGGIEKILLSTNPKKYPKRRELAEKIIRYWNSDKNAEYFLPCVIEWCKGYYHPADMFDELVKIQFNGKEYYAVKDYDKILRLEYGDYMLLPPEEERVWKHHPLIVDFAHNYEELLRKD